MTVTKIDLIKSPNPTLREPIINGLMAFNAQVLGPANRESIAILLRDPTDDEVVGGIWAIFSHEWLFIEFIFVPETLRGTGAGSSLMAKAEDAAKKRGCKGAHLETFDFQAPRFYEKLGYTRYGKLDSLVGCEQFFYVKKFSESEA
jgi:GNAT superfamily N-acetyltransferase